MFIPSDVTNAIARVSAEALKKARHDEDFKEKKESSSTTPP